MIAASTRVESQVCAVVSSVCTLVVLLNWLSPTMASLLPKQDIWMITIVAIGVGTVTTVRGVRSGLGRVRTVCLVNLILGVIPGFLLAILELMQFYRTIARDVDYLPPGGRL